MSRLQVPIICIVIGEGSSGGALAIGVGDKILMLENAIYSVLSPEGFASILYKDASKNEQAAEEMKITAKELKELGIIDQIIQESAGGAQNDIEQTCQNMKKVILTYLKQLQKMDMKTLLENRYEKFRKIGCNFIRNER